MQLVNGKLMMERVNCSMCNAGQIPGRKRCQSCNGTGKGKRGKVHGCKECYGYGTRPDWDNPVPCPKCDGAYQHAEPETLQDTLPESIWQGLTFKVYRSADAMTFNESNVGLGCVFSCVDYGEAHGKDDASVIDSVRKYAGHQACKVAREDGTLCDHVAIVVKPDGYTVRAVFNA